MSTIRQQIVNALETRLKTITVANGYATAIGSKVYPWRKTEIDEADLPAICFWDQSAEMQRETLKGATSHTLSITVALFVTGKTTPAQARDGLNDILKAIWTDPYFGGLAVQYVPKSHELTMEVDGDICGAGQVKFDLQYYTSSPGTL